MSVLKLKNIQYEKKEVKICLFALCVILLISAAAWLLSKPGKRYNFCFESADTGMVAVEYRYLPHKGFPENVLQYADELVIGPKTERYRLLFSSGTYFVSRFVRNDVLYVNLSADVLDMSGSCSDIKTGIDLFKKNILNTFGKIKAVEMYIDNKSIYTVTDEDVKN